MGKVLGSDAVNGWESLLDYITNYKVGESLYRSNMKCDQIQGEIKINQGWTLDNYRIYLTKAGYLKWIFPGCYRYVKQIPVPYPTMQEVRRAAYEKR